MSGCHPDSSVSQAVGCVLPVCSLRCEEQHSNLVMKEPVNITSDDVGFSSLEEKVSISTSEHCGEENLGGHGCEGSTTDTGCDENGTPLSEALILCQKFSQSVSLGAKTQKCLSKCNTFPMSGEMQAYSSATNARADCLGSGGRGQGYHAFASGTSPYTRSISLPTSANPVSAMKGGRALKGMAVQPEMRVKWAPEVYDPPASSMSHTVRSHQPRSSKSKKKEKYKKGKSSRANGSDKKHGYRKNSNKSHELPNVRLQGNGDGLTPGKAKMADVFEYGIHIQEAKCGSSFFGAAMANVHMPIGEAS